jgi:hypothetical protein
MRFGTLRLDSSSHIQTQRLNIADIADIPTFQPCAWHSTNGIEYSISSNFAEQTRFNQCQRTTMHHGPFSLLEKPSQK